MKFSFRSEWDKLVEDYHIGEFNGKKYFARYRKEKEEFISKELECEKEFFKKFFRTKSDKVSSIIVETDDREVWIWTKSRKWEFVKKLK